MIAPARAAAYDVLSALSSERADLAHALPAAREALQDDRDRALAAEIAFGVQRWRGALDHLIAHYAARQVERLDREVLDILRLSAYQLLHLTRVPASAVVDDAVKLTQRVKKRSASGFVNAVLRAISRHRARLPLPPRPREPVQDEAALNYLSITLSHPRWLVSRWYRRHGFAATEAWLLFNNGPAPLTLRTNRLRNTPEELIERLRQEHVAVRRASRAPDALIVETGAPLKGPGLRLGWFVVQDEASQLVTLLADVRPGLRVLDTCASPGGKTTALAAAMEGRGLVIASDVREPRVELLRRTVAASGATNVRLVRADLRQPLPYSCSFDRVFVDAPCSGLGTLRRDPDIRWRRREDDLQTLARSQLDMLCRAAVAVAPGGFLIYATCSSEPEENGEVAAAFLTKASHFRHVDLATASTGTALPPDVITAQGRFETLPHRHGLDAFFGVVFRREIEAGPLAGGGHL